MFYNFINRYYEKDLLYKFLKFSALYYCPPSNTAHKIAPFEDGASEHVCAWHACVCLGVCVACLCVFGCVCMYVCMCVCTDGSLVVNPNVLHTWPMVIKPLEFN